MARKNERHNSSRTIAKRAKRKKIDWSRGIRQASGGKARVTRRPASYSHTSLPCGSISTARVSWKEVTRVLPLGKRTAATGWRNGICQTTWPLASNSTTRLESFSGTRTRPFGKTSIRPPLVPTLTGKPEISAPLASRRANRLSELTQAISPLGSFRALLMRSPAGR